MAIKQFNLKVDETVLDEFSMWAALQGSNATEKLRQYMISVTKDEIPDDYQEQLEARINQTLHELVDEKSIDRLAKLVADRLGIQSISKQVVDIDNIDGIDVEDKDKNIDDISNIDEGTKEENKGGKKKTIGL